jgi:hypothetical protein
MEPRRSARLAAKALKRAFSVTPVPKPNAVPAKKARTPQTRKRAALARQALGIMAQMGDPNIALRRQAIISTIHFVCDNPRIVKAECARLIDGLTHKIASMERDLANHEDIKSGAPVPAGMLRDMLAAFARFRACSFD